MEELELKPPLGKFIINNAKGVQGEDGVYYHYTEVLKLLKLYKEKEFQNGNHVQYRQGRIFIYIGQQPFDKGQSVVFNPYQDKYFTLPTEDLKLTSEEPR